MIYLADTPFAITPCTPSCIRAVLTASRVVALWVGVTAVVKGTVALDVRA